MSAAQVGAAVLFLVLGSVGSFLLGVEIAARPGQAMIASANDQYGAQVSLQANGSLGTGNALGAGATSPRRRSSGVHVKLGSSTGKDTREQNGALPGPQGQPGTQTPAQAGGTDASGNPATDGSGAGTNPASGGAVSGTPNGSSTPTPSSVSATDGSVTPSPSSGSAQAPESPLASTAFPSSSTTAFSAPAGSGGLAESSLLAPTAGGTLLSPAMP